jgi:hypothetical protein
MEAKDTQFLAEMYVMVHKMEELIERFDMSERVMAAVIVGVIDDYDMDEEGATTEMKTMYSFNLADRIELETIKNLMDDMYKNDDDPLDNLLDGLGISLN